MLPRPRRACAAARPRRAPAPRRRPRRPGPPGGPSGRRARPGRSTRRARAASPARASAPPTARRPGPCSPARAPPRARAARSWRIDTAPLGRRPAARARPKSACRAGPAPPRSQSCCGPLWQAPHLDGRRILCLQQRHLRGQLQLPRLVACRLRLRLRRLRGKQHRAAAAAARARLRAVPPPGRYGGFVVHLSSDRGVPRVLRRGGRPGGGLRARADDLGHRDSQGGPSLIAGNGGRAGTAIGAPEPGTAEAHTPARLACLRSLLTACRTASRGSAARRGGDLFAARVTPARPTMFQVTPLQWRSARQTAALLVSGAPWCPALRPCNASGLGQAGDQELYCAVTRAPPPHTVAAALCKPRSSGKPEAAHSVLCPSQPEVYRPGWHFCHPPAQPGVQDGRQVATGRGTR